MSSEWNEGAKDLEFVENGRRNLISFFIAVSGVADNSDVVKNWEFVLFSWNNH